ncbi:MAG: DUF3426 domain-containing protein [Ramlibacter sp.]
MSMITGCPACGTLFKVVPDQLKISDGWVRCGHCSEVFDAAANMRQPIEEDDGYSTAPATMSAPLMEETPPPTAPPTPTPPPTPAPVAATPTVSPPVPTAPAKPAPRESVLPSYYPSDALEVREVSSLSQIDAEPGPASRIPAEADVGDKPPVRFVRSDVEHSRPHIELLDEEDEEPVGLHDPALDDVTFVRAARRKVFWQRPLVRLLLGLVAVALVLLLAAQVAVQERERLAAQHPQWRAALQALCLPVGCKVGPQRRIDAVVIDSSGFTRLRQDAYRLSVTLKNQAAQPVAVPALELTLTDTQDQPLLRRVLLPRDFGASADTLAPTSDWSTSVTVSVNGSAAAGRVAGYRLLAFYP